MWPAAAFAAGAAGGQNLRSHWPVRLDPAYRDAGIGMAWGAVDEISWCGGLGGLVSNWGEDDDEFGCQVPVQSSLRSSRD